MQADPRAPTAGGADRCQVVDADDVDVRLEFDQSPYVRNSIRGLVMEGLLGAALTGLMVLIFLRDWRSALVVCIASMAPGLGSSSPAWAT